MENVPENKPLIIVANHQSFLHDITTIIWFLRKVHPKFISKISNWEKEFRAFPII